VLDEHDDFAGVRQNVYGHPMWDCLAYTKRYWPRFTAAAVTELRLNHQLMYVYTSVLNIT